MARARLIGEDVEPGTEPARNELRDEGVLVDDLAARSVDETGPVAHEGELRASISPSVCGVSGTCSVTMSDSPRRVSRAHSVVGDAEVGDDPESR